MWHLNGIRDQQTWGTATGMSLQKMAKPERPSPECNLSKRCQFCLDLQNARNNGPYTAYGPHILYILGYRAVVLGTLEVQVLDNLDASPPVCLLIVLDVACRLREALGGGPLLAVAKVTEIEACQLEAGASKHHGPDIDPK